MGWAEPVMVVAPSVSSYLLARAAGARGAVEVLLLGFLLFCGQILVTGYATSFAGVLASAPAWALTLGVLAAAGIVACVAPQKLRARCVGLPRIDVRCADLHLRRSGLAALVLAGATVVLLGLVNLALALFIAPHTVDSLTYHLARVGYYLHQGNLGSFEANYANQVIHAKGSPVLAIYAWLASGHVEGAMLLVQYTAYWVGAIAVYGIARRAGTDRRHGTLAALAFSLLTICLMQASTPQNDLLLGTMLGCSVYFLLGARSQLLWAGMAIGIACAIKFSAVLSLPALGVVALLRDGFDRRSLGDGAALAASACLGVALLALPAGYVDNYRHSGSWFGPRDVFRSWTFEGRPAGYVLVHGSKNALRYGIEFLSLDGLPPVEPVVAVQRALRAPASLLLRAGIDLTDAEASYLPFSIDRAPRAREEYSYWGVLGLGLFWIVPWVLVRAVQGFPRARVLAAAATCQFLAVSFSGVFDPWHGRFFIPIAFLALPAIACFVQQERGRLVRAYVAMVLVLASASAVCAVAFREHASLVSFRYGTHSVTSVFLLDRAAQSTRHIPKYAAALRAYEALVPGRAVVAIYGDYMFEYLFFGEGMTRRLVPLGDGRQPMRPIPSDTDFLVFSSKALDPTPQDAHLGEDWYLRTVAPPEDEA